MNKKNEREPLKEKITAWVDGEREPKDQTLFVMEQQHQYRFPRPTEEEFQRRERSQLQKFFSWYPVAAGVICAVMLSVASKVMAVPVDERIPKIRECLPGANCGACGYAGCADYA